MAQSWSVTVWNHSVHFRICCHWFNLSVWSKSVKCIHYVVPSKIQSRNNTVPQCSVLHLLITLYNFAPVSDDAKMINNGPRSIHVMPKKATVFLKKKYLEFWITSRPCCLFFKCVLFETLKLASSTSQINLVQIPAEATMLSVAASRDASTSVCHFESSPPRLHTDVIYALFGEVGERHFVRFF